MAHPDILDEDVDDLGHPRRLYAIALNGDEPIVILHLLDPAKQKLGEDADVFLRVPPDEESSKRARGGQFVDESFWKATGGKITKCREAVAWTFGMLPDEYRPLIEI